MLEEHFAENESSQLKSVIKNKLYASESDDDSDSDNELTNKINEQEKLPGTKYFDQINYDSDFDQENLGVSTHSLFNKYT